MNWPQELIIRMNDSKDKIINKTDIINFITKYCDVGILEEYLNNLKSQNIISLNEIVELIEVTENRINKIKKIKEEYELSKYNEEKLADFYEKNSDIFKDLIDMYII